MGNGYITKGVLVPTTLAHPQGERPAPVAGAGPPLLSCWCLKFHSHRPNPFRCTSRSDISRNPTHEARPTHHPTPFTPIHPSADALAISVSTRRRAQPSTRGAPHTPRNLITTPQPRCERYDAKSKTPNACSVGLPRCSPRKLERTTPHRTTVLRTHPARNGGLTTNRKHPHIRKVKGDGSWAGAWCASWSERAVWCCFVSSVRSPLQPSVTWYPY